MSEQEFQKLKTDCEIYKIKIDKMEVAVAKIQDRVSNLEAKSEKTDFQYEQIMKMLDKLTEQTIPELSKEIQDLKNKPAERYNTIVGAIISALVGGIIGFVVSRIFSRN